jgi:hypothetical protein
MKKLSKAYIILVGTILKKNTSTILKTRKAPLKVRVLLKSPTKAIVKALFKEVVILGVVEASALGRIIRLL